MRDQKRSEAGQGLSRPKVVSVGNLRRPLFGVMALADIRLRDYVLVPAGAVGMAVLHWRGQDEGWLAEFKGHGIVGLPKASEGHTWRRVDVTPRCCGKRCEHCAKDERRLA